ncbi:MAG: DNA-binding transcriptional regulator Fis [Gammaproteobacteria bacterium]|nr:DNA-binding transcriptional regulator Fis [Gammaproteobacteria bacterium]
MTLANSVEKELEHYFKQLDGAKTCDLYELVLAEVERPLLCAVMNHVDQNQTRAADLLGLSRGTLRKKLKTYGLM